MRFQLVSICAHGIREIEGARGVLRRPPPLNFDKAYVVKWLLGYPPQLSF